MNEYLLTVICVLIGIICGAPFGYLLGRYRIKIRRVVFQEDGQEVQGTKLTLKAQRKTAQ